MPAQEHSEIIKQTPTAFINFKGKIKSGLKIFNPKYSSNSTRLKLFFLYAALIYITIVVIYGLLYKYFGNVYMSSTNSKADRLFDNIYFSFVSFATIGYGDYYPFDDCTKSILLTETFIALCYSSMFSGLFVYLLLKRPKNYFFSKSVAVTFFENGDIKMYFRFANKGGQIQNAKFVVEVAEKMDTLYFRHSKSVTTSMTYIGKAADILLCNFSNTKTSFRSKMYQDVLFGEKKMFICVGFTGIDINTGETVYINKIYKKSDVLFVNSDIFVIENGKFNWKTLDKYTPTTEENIKRLKEMTFE